jgi:CarD family transcriptional regulator
MFKAGEYVIKPNTGICRITEIVKMNLGGSGEKDYYLLQPINDSRSTLYVTVDADRTRLRLAMSKEEAEDFIREIPNIEAAWIANDKLREQRYKDAFRSNEAAELVAIIKNMYIRGQERMAAGKKTTATDIKYFQQAEEILCSELAFSLGIKKEEVNDVITKTIDIA